MTLQSSFCLAIAGVYSNEGAEAYAKKDYSNAVYFATEGIKVNCKDEDLMAIMYNNRAYANLFLGELMCRCLFVLGGGGGSEHWAGSKVMQRVVSSSDLQSSRSTGYAFRSGHHKLRGNEFNSMLVNSQLFFLILGGVLNHVINLNDFCH